MRFIIFLLINISLFANTFNFKEYRLVHAVDTTFNKSGVITIDGKKITIEYKKPNYKKIVSDGEVISIEDDSHKVRYLKGRALFYTKAYMSLIVNVENAKELKSNDMFDVELIKDKHLLYPKNEMKKQVPKIEVDVVEGKIRRFKMFMLNEDTVEIVKE